MQQVHTLFDFKTKTLPFRGPVVLNETIADHNFSTYEVNLNNVGKICRYQPQQSTVGGKLCTYRKTSNIRRTLVANTIVDHRDVVGASGFGATYIRDLTVISFGYFSPVRWDLTPWIHYFGNRITDRIWITHPFPSLQIK